MAVNASFAGRTYPATAPYAVGREKIREFAEAVGAVDPVHT
ncbi:MAG TPA: MaoC family dehydratase N-terminal domain-containing protein, partial [Oryzihumus sp.]|nr:MaoC family dehydratase N-terminal domain-containing protein [Oryzihumus sp.]